MPSDPQDHLRDIVACVQEIQQFLGGLSMLDYAADRRTRLAVERLLQIMTEAAYRLGPTATELCPEIDWSGIRGLGNFLRHEYDKVDDEIIWRILHHQLPVLAVAVQRAIVLREREQDRT